MGKDTDIKIALAGNPNCGKTTLFNSLTGSAQYVGNWPGVTVEKKEGKLKGHEGIIIQDLPGIYSLSPYTLEEVVARNYLVNDKPDVIINIIDGTNIERNLYLTTQLVELGIPMLVVVNMMDLVVKRKDSIDLERLSEGCGCEVVAISALKGEGLQDMVERAVGLAGNPQSLKQPSVFGGSAEHAIAHIEEAIKERVDARFLRWFAIKLFERDEKVIAELDLPRTVAAHIEQHIADCEAELDDDAESIITNERYASISRIVRSAVRKRSGGGQKMSVSDKIDRIVTNRLLALPIFAAVMFVVYFISITTLGAVLTDWTNDALFGEWIIPGATGFLEGLGVAPWLVSLIADGIIGGVGSVLGFVPQMLILFLMLCVLEDVGYMARVAFIMDRIFRRFGLSGKSFIPMLIGSGCGVPAIMASRTIENERDRRMTIMTTTFIPCGAKMPIVGLIAGAVFGGAWWVAPSAYFIGVAAVIVSGVILKKLRAFEGEAAPFIMELPAYHVPAIGNVLRGTWERGWSFIKRAGTVILAASVLIWFTSGFSFAGGLHMVEDMDASMLATVGSAVAVVFAPLGFGTWQSAVATIMGLVAKEEVVGVFGVLYGVAGDALGMVEDGTLAGLAPVAAHFTALSAYSFLLFNLLCAPCFAAMGAMRREMNSARWTWAAIGYMCGFAYAISLIVYQFGMLFSGHGFTVASAAAILVFAFLLYALFRKGSAGRAARGKTIRAAMTAEPAVSGDEGEVEGDAA